MKLTVAYCIYYMHLYKLQSTAYLIKIILAINSFVLIINPPLSQV